MPDTRKEPHDPAFLTGGGEMGALMRAHDWSTSPLGPPGNWPQPLRTIVDLMLHSRFPMFAAWGDGLGFLYNDAYVEILGAKHPGALGGRFREVWSEIWPDISPLIAAALGGESTYHEDLPLVMNRSGYDENTWFTFSYSPVRDESGRIAGMFCACTETTQRVLADRRADAERERQRQMLRQMPGFVGMLSGPDLVYEYVNDAYVQISERTDFVGRRFRDVFADLTGQGFHELFETVFHSGEGLVTRGMELRLHGREEAQYVDFALEPIRDDDGGVTGVFVAGYEATEVYRANEALRESEARLRELNADLEREVTHRSHIGGKTWSLSPEIMGVATDDGFFESSNPAWRETLGWTEDEIARTPILDLVHPDDRQPTVLVMKTLYRGEGVFRFKNRYRHKDGSYRWLSWVAVPDEGKYYCSARDITAEVAAEAERDRLWTLSEDMLARADYGGGMSAVNPAWTKVLGWSEKKLLTEPYADIIHPDNVETVVAALQEMGRTGQPTRFENRILSAEGVWKPIGWTVAPEPDGANFIAVGRDLTEDKARERELIEAQEALRQSQKMEAMGSLTGGVAHDFNNLLTPIIGSLDMLMRRGLGNEREQRLIDGALQSADRAKTLVQRLLAFARRQPLQPVAVDLDGLVHGMAGLIGSTVGPKINVRVELDPDLPPAEADPNQIEMAVLNLAVNARDAMPEGGVLTIAAARESVRSGHRAALRPGHYVRLSVSDTGSGMDEATLARAIEPFFSTKGIGKGTGLGLSMVHGLTSQLNGGLTIASKPGEGTVVELWLPISAIAIAGEDGPTAPLAEPRRLGTALLVDDEELVRMSTADMLMDLGFEVVEASSAEEALRLVDGGVLPDLLVTDHLMPGMTGVELAKALRSRKPALPILVVSGYAEVDGIAPGLPRLAKPFRNAELAASLAALVPAAAE